MDPVFPAMMEQVTRPDLDYVLAGSIRVATWAFYLGDPVEESFRTLMDQNLLVLVGSGASMVRVDELDQSLACLGPAALFFRGEMAAKAVLGRKQRERVAIGWRPHSAAVVEPWLDSALGPGKAVRCRAMSCAPREVQLRHRWLLEHLSGKPPYRLPQVMAGLIEVLASVVEAPPPGQDGPCTSHVSAPVRRVMEAVAQRPGAKWSLAVAAEVAQYSQYHLSRRFGIEVGRSFHSYVEHCRATKAFNLLISPGMEDRMAQVAVEAGFESVRKMRATCSRVLGLTPHEVVHRARSVKM